METQNKVISTMSDYKLCERAGLVIENICGYEVINAGNVEALLSKGRWFYGESSQDRSEEMRPPLYSWRLEGFDMRAWVLELELINKEPEEIRLLREFVACCKVDDPKLRWGELRANAQDFLKRRDGGK